MGATKSGLLTFRHDPATRGFDEPLSRGLFASLPIYERGEEGPNGDALGAKLRRLRSGEEMAMTPAELRTLLPPHSVFAGCSEAELAALLRVATLLPMKAGETILEQGEEGEAMLILLEGVARVGMVTSNGREIILDYAEPGAVLGEIAVLDGEPRTASATALWKGRLLRVKQRAFLEFVEGHPKVAMALLRDMARRLRESDATIETDRAFATGPRLARYLKRLTEQKANGHRLAGDLSQSELGNFVGISRENINRQLSVWAGAGVIELAQGRVRILDRAYINQIAEAGD